LPPASASDMDSRVKTAPKRAEIVAEPQPEKNSKNVKKVFDTNRLFCYLVHSRIHLGSESDGYR